MHNSSGPEVLKQLCSTKLSKKFEVLIHVNYQEFQIFSGSNKPRMLFFLFINVIIPPVIGTSAELGQHTLRRGAEAETPRSNPATW